MNRPTHLATGITSGLIAGLAASLVMEGFQRLWANAEPMFRNERAKPAAGEPATVKAADLVSELVLGRPVPEKYRPLAGDVMHYGLGCAVGAAYGLGSAFPPLRTGRGAVYGTLLWLVLDEGMLPALGLAKPWARVPARVHAFAWASHLVFGLCLEHVSTGARRRLPR